MQKGTHKVALEKTDNGNDLLSGKGPSKNIRILLRYFGHTGKPVEVTIDGRNDDLKIDLKKPEES